MPEDRGEAARETLIEAVRRLARAFREGGIDGAEQDARILVAAAAGCARERLVAAPDEPFTPAAAARLAGFAERRLRREPVSRILGRRAFYGRDFEVTAATLDPRPETETLVEVALEIASAEGWRERPIRILDVGTGTGCLVATLLAELPAATGLGTDISRQALAVAERNARAIGVGERVEFLLTRSLAGIGVKFDLVVSNPPYIPSGDIAALEPDVRDYDPQAALDGGGDGLFVYRELMDGLGRALGAGWALFEVGAGQADEVSALVRAAIPAARLAELRILRDLGGHDRCVAVRTQL